MTTTVYVDIEEALYLALATAPALSDYVGDRIHAQITTQATRPYVVFEAQSATPITRTPTPELEATYRVSVYAKTRPEAHSVQEVIHTALMNSAFPIADYRCYAVIWLGMRTDFSIENGRVIWAVTGDYRVRWVWQGV